MFFGAWCFSFCVTLVFWVAFELKTALNKHTSSRSGVPVWLQVPTRRVSARCVRLKQRRVKKVGDATTTAWCSQFYFTSPVKRSHKLYTTGSDHNSKYLHFFITKAQQQRWEVERPWLSESLWWQHALELVWTPQVYSKLLVTSRSVFMNVGRGWCQVSVEDNLRSSLVFQ